MPIVRPRPPAYIAPDLPSAADLSGPGNLSAYVASCLASTGIVQLPPGHINNCDSVFINRDAVIFRGAGCPYGNRTAYGTVLTPANANAPAITIRNALGCKVADLGILNAAIGVSIEGSVGALAFHNKLLDVAVCNADVGVRVSEPAGTRVGQYAAADVRIEGSRFTSCTRGVEVNHNQSVNLHVTNQCYFYDCDYAAYVVQGGRTVIRDSCSNPVGTWLRLLSGGGNEMPHVLSNLYSDRTGGSPPPKLIDARGVIGSLIVSVRDYSVSFDADVDGPWADFEFDHIIAPTDAWARANAVYNIDEASFNAPGSIVPV